MSTNRMPSVSTPSVIESPEVTLVAASGRVWMYVPTGKVAESGKKLYFAVGMSAEGAVEFADEVRQMAALVQAGRGEAPLSVVAHLGRGEKVQ